MRPASDLCFPGGDGAEVCVQPAELLDDPVPETVGCQAPVTAHAGTVQSRHAETSENQTVLLLNCILLQEAGVEKELVNLLCRLSAQHYLPVLAHHRVTIEALRHMNSSDLKKVRL